MCIAIKTVLLVVLSLFMLGCHQSITLVAESESPELVLQSEVLYDSAALAPLIEELDSIPQFQNNLRIYQHDKDVKIVIDDHTNLVARLTTLQITRVESNYFYFILADSKKRKR
jgi:hypothetical protein